MQMLNYMPRLNKVRATALNQRGVIQLIVLLILLLGLVGGVLLVTRGEPLKFLPKAGGGISGPISPTTSLTLASQKSNYSVGEEVEIQLLVRSDIDAANLFAAKLQFPADLLEVVSINHPERTYIMNPYMIKNWIEKSFDNQTGTISLAGGVPNPGFQSSLSEPAPLMADITFKAKAVGTATIAFADSSAIYKNADNMDILGIKNSLEVIIGDSSSLPVPSLSPTPSVSTAPLPSPSPSSNPLPTGLKGDGNRNNRIDLGDMSVLLSDFHKTGGFRSEIDMNADGTINTFDFSLLRKLLIEIGIIKGDSGGTINDILTNGSFENGLQGWTCQGNISGTCIANSQEKVLGGFSGAVTNIGGGSWGWQLAQGGIRTNNDEQLCLMALVKKPSVESKISVAIQEADEPWRQIERYATETTTNWQQVNSTVIRPADWSTSTIQVFIRIYSTGTALFDEVSLTRGACPTG